MSGKKTKAVICILCLLLSHCTALLAELIIPPDKSAIINRELTRDLNQYPLNLNHAQQIGDKFALWVSQSMDFGAATVRMSRQFDGRETFYEELAENIPIFMFGRGTRGLESDMPVPIIHRRSEGRFSFRKLLDVETQTIIPDETALNMATAFLEDLGLVEQTVMDKFGEIIFPKLVQHNPAEDEEDPDVESVILQQVRFSRLFGGRPVLNSRISVDFHPDTLEVLGFKHYNWALVHERSASPVPRGDVKTREQVEDTLRRTAAEYWTPEQEATLTQVIPGWFQTDTGLIPIIAFEISRPETGSGDVLSALINVAGPDEVFQATSKFTPDPLYAADCFPTTNPHYSDWVLLGRPSCWCAPYQCDGDTDDDTSGFPANFRIHLRDLNILVDNWQRRIDNPLLDPCADIDHKDSGALSRYRVSVGDLNILVGNWQKRDRDLRGDCPRPE